MKALLLATLACFVPSLLLEGSSGTAHAQRPSARAAKQRPVEKNTRGASAKKKRGMSRSLLEDYFAVGDYDANGSMSYREAHSSLAISRAGFARYDVDRDGLIDLEEFITRYTAALLTGDSLPEPVPERKNKDKQPARNAVQIRLAFDVDADGRLDANELQSTLDAYAQNTLDGADALSRLDVNSSGFLEFSELEGLVPLLFSGDSLGIVNREPTEEGEEAPEINSILDLFGERTLRLSETKAVPLPPRIAGPLDHFNRLDFDRSGTLTFEDLDALMRPIQSSIRLNAVLATLDTNEDGILSPEEFWSSMQD